MIPDLGTPDGWLELALIVTAGAAVIVLIAQGANLGALARRAASTWNRGKAVHDRIELTRADKKAWRGIRRRFTREARHAAHAADNSEKRPA